MALNTIRYCAIGVSACNLSLLVSVHVKHVMWRTCSIVLEHKDEEVRNERNRSHVHGKENWKLGLDEEDHPQCVCARIGPRVNRTDAAVVRCDSVQQTLVPQHAFKEARLRLARGMIRSAC